MTTLSANARVLAHALSLSSHVEDEDVARLSALPARVVEFRSGSVIMRQGDRPTESCLLVDGFVCRDKYIEEGERQILSVHLPGEMPDLQSLHLERMDHGLTALLQSTVAFVPHNAIQKLVDEAPRLRAALWRATLIDASIFREWLAGVGARSATQRAAHLFCEIYFRARMLGTPPDRAAIVPLTRDQLGDALGLSAVHVSRVVQKLRAMSTVKVARGEIRIEDWERLRQFCTFSPVYLHYRAPLAADLA